MRGNQFEREAALTGHPSPCANVSVCFAAAEAVVRFRAVELLSVGCREKRFTEATISLILVFYSVFFSYLMSLETHWCQSHLVFQIYLPLLSPLICIFFKKL